MRWYDPGVPIDIVVPELTLPAFLQRAASHHPRRSALRYLGTSITYEVLDEAASRFAGALVSLGVQRGDRVALHLPDSPELVAALLGVLRAGAVALPTDPALDAEDAIRLWARGGVRVAVIDAAGFAGLASASGDAPSVQHLVVANIAESLPALRKFQLALSGAGIAAPRLRLPRESHIHTFATLLKRSSAQAPRVNLTVGDLALLQPEQPASGEARLAMLTHANLAAGAYQLLGWIGASVREDGADVILGGLPLSHVHGLTSVLTFSVVNGSTAVIAPHMTAAASLEAIARERVTFMPGSPSLYAGLVAGTRLRRRAFGSVNALMSVPAPLDGEVRASFERSPGAHVAEGYAPLSSPMTHCNPLGAQRRAGTIGLPLPSTYAAVFDPETRTKLLASGEIGELAVRGPQVMRGYWMDPNATADVLHEGWFFTGDLVLSDDDGYFSLAGDSDAGDGRSEPDGAGNKEPLPAVTP